MQMVQWMLKSFVQEKCGTSKAKKVNLRIVVTIIAGWIEIPKKSQPTAKLLTQKRMVN